MSPKDIEDIVETTVAVAQQLVVGGTSAVAPGSTAIDKCKIDLALEHGWLTTIGQHVAPAKRGWILVARLMAIPTIPTHLYPEVLRKAGELG